MKKETKSTLNILKENKLYIFFILTIISIIFLLFLLKIISKEQITFFNIITIFGTLIGIWLFYIRNKHIETQLEQTNEQLKITSKQIKIQDNTRKDQKFLDAIKLITESKENIDSKLGGLHILENLAKTSPEYRQRILDYLGTHTEKLKNFTFSFKDENYLVYHLLERRNNSEKIKYEYHKEVEHYSPNENYYHEIIVQCCYKEFKIKLIPGTPHDFPFLLINNEKISSSFLNKYFEENVVSEIFKTDIFKNFTFEIDFIPSTLSFRILPKNIDNKNIVKYFENELIFKFPFEFFSLELVKKILKFKNNLNINALFFPNINYIIDTSDLNQKIKSKKLILMN